MPERIEVRATRNGGRDYIEVPTAEEALITALMRERAGYVQRGLAARVAAVDAELNRLGADRPTDHTDTPETGAKTDGRQRQGRRPRRAAADAAGSGAAAEGR